MDGGKIYDLLFVGMPRLESRDGGTALTRSSLTLGTKETFFYISMLLNLGERMETLNQAAGFSGMTQKLAQAFSDSGVTADDWKAAFGLELGSLADWPSSAHWPTLLLTLPVLDVAMAGKIVEAATRADPQGSFHHSDKAVVGVEVRPAIGARLVGVDNDV